ncbi:hypothetical protein FHS18_003487 [Paenibacillus phyllosphaerae]|uniref:Uncharacterized protein n=1 Tax=Paenibacillus phyllosphaerae TaxID=274593 RepID=A0A7W5FNV9_9BACL|nr:DUF5696 domain-containing protein [Paenibacillus phyllosphaerae]MBB3111419.1 hypothetical protein [Paenibacillus phyllosphaerae]
MTKRKWNGWLLVRLAFSAVVLVITGWIAYLVWDPSGSGQEGTASAASLFDTAGQSPYKAGLPSEQGFKVFAETNSLQLLVDETTAHFQVVQKATGNVWRSYPNPANWKDEKISGAWKNNLASPIVVEYVNAKNYKSSSVTNGLVENQGYLEDFKQKDNGFTVTFAFPKIQFKIPVEVTLREDYVETRLIDSGIVEGELSLLNVKLYPLFGSEPSTGQEGYILLPDGSGSLIQFQSDRTMPQLTYNESVYGPDLSYYNEYTDRQRIAMPVYGMKSGEQAFLAIIAEGESYANVYAAPAGSVGISNWVTSEWQYRKRFFQSVSKSSGEGFYTYSGDRFVSDSRATRYYLLGPEKSNYAGMAEVYRNYLIGEKGVTPIKSVKPEIPLYVDLVGADIEKGLFFDSYLKATTTDEAESVVRQIHERGIGHMQIHYAGWQQDGYSTHGGYLPVDKRLGGNQGMKDFIAYAHSLDIPVYLTADYTLNTNGDDGFWWRRDGLRNLAGTVLEEQLNPDQDASTYVSPKFYRKVIASDLDAYKALGADGIDYEGGIAQEVITDFNSRYSASRADVVQIQRDILQQSHETLGSVVASNANFYALDKLDHVHRLTGDYSYDVFVTEPIPFAQIVLHGLKTYTLEWSNVRDEWDDEFLRMIEFGAYPAYVLTGEQAENLRRSYSVWYYSMNVKDWLDRIEEEYAQANEALAPVQDRFITDHRTLAEGVKETVYGGDYRIIVNYNETAYVQDGLTVPANNFIVVKGGA